MRTAHAQWLRFVTVGLASNLGLYLLYLLLTMVGLGPKSAMTLLFALGMLQTFVLNKCWTFQHHGFARVAFVKYGLVYALGYVVNLAALFLLVDQLGLPHQPVQGLMILSLAVVFFLLHKLWVFRVSSPA